MVAGRREMTQCAQPRFKAELLESAGGAKLWISPVAGSVGSAAQSIWLDV